MENLARVERSVINNTLLTANGNTLINNYFYKQVGKNSNLAVPLYLIAAYAYYIEDDPLVSDDCFDWLSKFLQENWDEITHHHKKHLSLDSLEAGTYLGEYPAIVKGAVKDLRMSNNL